MRQVAVLGASGNVGKGVVKALLARESIERIVLINRRQLDGFADERVQQVKLASPFFSGVQRVVDLSTPELVQQAAAAELQGIDAAFVTLGAGQPRKLSKDELEKVDCLLPSAFAHGAKEAGVRHLSLLSAIGADIAGKHSALTGSSAGGGWYQHVKGQVEKNFQEAGVQSVCAFRPSTILGNTNTPGFVAWLAPKVDCVIPTKYQSIHANDIGVAMVNAADKALTAAEPQPFAVFEGKDLFDLFRQS